MQHMRLAATALIALLTLFAGLHTAIADDDAPLFVNLTTDEPHRATMALGFAKNQLERNHPVTIFLNDRGVMLATKGNSDKFKSHQETLATIMSGGGAVIICPMCMKHYEVAESDLIDGVQMGNPELTGKALFEDDTVTLTW